MSSATTTEVKVTPRPVRVLTQPDGPGEWLKIEEAARRWGCSERTVRRKVAARAVESRLDDAGRRVVWVATRTRGVTTHGHDGVTPSELLELLAQAQGARAEEVRDARRSARHGWTVAVAVGVLAGAGAVVAAWWWGSHGDDVADLRSEVADAQAEAEDAQNRGRQMAQVASEAQTRTLSMAAEVARLEASEAAQRARADELAELLAQEQRRHAWTWPPMEGNP